MLRKRLSSRTFLKTALIIVSVFVFGSSGYSQTEKIQTAYIYNLIKLIEWPNLGQSAEFRIGVLGNNDPIVIEFRDLANSKSYYGKKISLEIYRTPQEIRDCHLLYIPESYDISKAIDVVKNNHTLLIGEKRGGINKGLAINFIEVSNKLQFEYKPGNATKYGLKVNSSIEKLAYKVIK